MESVKTVLCYRSRLILFDKKIKKLLTKASAYDKVNKLSLGTEKVPDNKK